MGHHIDAQGRFQSDKYPDLGPDKIVVSFKHPQARMALRALAIEYATTDAELADDIRTRLRTIEAEEEAARVAAIPPVDRTQRVLADGRAETSDHREIDPATGMQKGYVVLSAEERAKGFVRPVRLSYVHKPCGASTRMARSIAETYARDPAFYSGTFCATCRTHLPLDQFVWEGTDEVLGT